MGNGLSWTKVITVPGEDPAFAQQVTVSYEHKQIFIEENNNETAQQVYIFLQQYIVFAFACVYYFLFLLYSHLF